MTKVIADISMSLDGYVTAPGVDLEHGLGIGGEAIHAWVLEEPRSAPDEAVLVLRVVPEIGPHTDQLRAKDDAPGEPSA